MKKRIINCLLSALMISTLAPLNTLADEAEAGSSLIIGEANSISLSSENAKNDGITAIQLSLNVETAADADVFFDFNDENGIKITDFRYNEESGRLNIYAADSEPVFKDLDLLELGSVCAEDADGNAVDVTITAPADALTLVSQTALTSRTFTVKNEAAPASTTEAQSGENGSGGTLPSETTTTAAEQSAAGNNCVIVKKTVQESYLITIPDGTNTLKEGQTFSLKAENVIIPHGESLRVSVTSANNWNLKDAKNPENNSAVSYSMGYGDDETALVNKTENIFTLAAGAGSGNVTLTILSIGEAKMAGTFADTLTFSVDVS